MPLVLPCAAMAANRSKKSKMIFVRASESTLMGIKVANASRAMFESEGEGMCVRPVSMSEAEVGSYLAPPHGTAHRPPR